MCGGTAVAVEATVTRRLAVVADNSREWRLGIKALQEVWRAGLDAGPKAKMPAHYRTQPTKKERRGGESQPRRGDESLPPTANLYAFFVYQSALMGVKLCH